MSIEAKTTVDLEKIRDDYKAAAAKIKRRIIICAGTGCVANGSLEVRDALAEALKKALKDLDQVEEDVFDVLDDESLRDVRSVLKRLSERLGQIDAAVRRTGE